MSSPHEPHPDGHSAEEFSQIEAELKSVQSQRDALQNQLSGTKDVQKRRFRRSIVGLLTTISVILITLSATVVWAHRTVLNTDVFVGTVGPVFEQPGVATAVATRATDQLYKELHFEARLRDNLPPKISFAAGPVTNATKSFVTEALTRVVASPAFQSFWTNSLRRTHEQVVAVLRGQSTAALTTGNGYVVLNTVPVINQALGSISGLASNLTGKQVTLPTITSAEVPQKAINKLSSALGVPLPSNFGQITLVRSKDLSSLQHAVRFFDRLTILLPIVTIAFLALALWLSLNRRLTLVRLLVASVLLLIVERRIIDYEVNVLANKAHNPEVAHGVLVQLLNGFFVLTAWILGVELAILIVALVTGPYRWAVALRGFFARGGRRIAHEFDAERRQLRRAWMSAHVQILQIVTAVVAVVLLLIVSVSWLSFLVIGALLAVFEIYLQRLKPLSEGPTDGAETKPTTRVPTGVRGPGSTGL